MSDEHPGPEGSDGLTRTVYGILSRHAARRDTLTYGELRLATGASGDLVPILRSISQSEEDAGRGLLTAVVVSPDTGLPGKGWFSLAADRGRDLTDPQTCWDAEMDSLHRIWSYPKGVSDPLTDAQATRRVVLTGFMGTGKSTVARLVAEHLGLEHVDTDTLIEERHGAIEQIFATRGEEAFRSLEREVASELALRSGLVVSTGGRMMLDPANRATLGAGATVVCLVASAAEILRRVQADGVGRPLLAGPEPLARIVELLGERESGYALFTQIETDGRSPDEVAADVVTVAVSSS